MIRYVVDASVAVEFLLKTNLGKTLTPLMARSLLMAPELMDAEVLAVLRRAVLKGQLGERRVMIAIEDLVTWPVERIPHRILVELAWEHRHNLSAYDSLYVAAARLYGVPLLTADGPLSRAPGIGVPVHNVCPN